MHSPPEHQVEPGTIVCGASGSPATPAVVRAAADLAAALGDRLVLVHVLSAAASPARVGAHRSGEPSLGRGDRAKAEAMLADLVRNEEETASCAWRVETGPVADGLAAAAEREEAELIVIGSGSSARVRAALGRDVAESLLGVAACPVVLVPVGPRAADVLLRSIGGLQRRRTLESSSRF